MSSNGLIRVIQRAEAPWWVLADVCAVLEIGNPSDAMRRLDDDEKGVDSVETPGGVQQINNPSQALTRLDEDEKHTLTINEGGNIKGLGTIGAMPTKRRP